MLDFHRKILAVPRGNYMLNFHRKILAASHDNYALDFHKKILATLGVVTQLNFHESNFGALLGYAQTKLIELLLEVLSISSSETASKYTP